MDKKQLDNKLKEIAREYLSLYKTKSLKIELNINEKNGVKLNITEFRTV